MTVAVQDSSFDYDTMGRGSMIPPYVIGAIGLVLLSIGLVLWSAFAPLASAVMAPGTVVVAESGKTLQSLDGGVIEAILAHDGDTVTEGQVLLRLDSRLQLNAMAALEFFLATNEAQQARFRAELSGSAVVAFNSHFGETEKIQHMMDNQRAEFLSRREGKRIRLDEIVSERSGNEAILIGVKEETLHTTTRLRLALDDIYVADGLAKTGNGTLRAKRESEAQFAGLQGDLAALSTRRSELDQQIRRSNLESEHIEQSFEESDELDLQKLATEQQDLRQRYAQATEALARTIIRSPVAGYVMNEAVHTIGGVIIPGAAILDVIPSSQTLIIETQVRPIDVEDIAIGSSVRMRSERPSAQAMPPITGRVVSVSPDRMFDRLRGDSYFLVRISVDRGKALLAAGFQLHPGIPLEVMIMKQSQTLLTYLTRPIFGAFVHTMKD